MMTGYPFMSGLAALAMIVAPPLIAATPSRPAPATSPAGEYQIGVGDELDITVFGQPDMSGKVRVRADGTVSVALLPSVPAADRTPDSLGAELARRYSAGGYLNNPSINVQVSNFAGKTVTVLGAVAKPGLYPLDRPYTLAEMVAKAGGSREGGANSVLLTTADGKTTRISLYDPASHVGQTLSPGDSLFIPAEEQIFVYGAVNKGGGYAYQPNMTYRQALALAGGPTVAGSTRSIEVRRDGKKIKAQIDDPVQPQDVLVIKEKLF